MMKKQIVGALCALIMPLTALAQFSGDGFYRVQNARSDRYLAFVDNKSKGVSGTSVDVALLHTWYDFEERVAFSPATICYFIKKSGSGSTFSVDAEGQGYSLSGVTGGMYLTLRGVSSPAGSYTISGSSSGATKYIADARLTNSDGEVVADKTATAASSAGNYAYWYFIPVDLNDNYLGVKGQVQATADGSYWSTLYTSMALRPQSADTKAYVVNRIVGEYAVVHEVSGIVPPATPVLFRCTSAAPVDNKLMPLRSGGSASTNYLNGNYYCNDVDDTGNSFPHRNVREFKPSTMRVLGVDSDGRPAFVSSTTAPTLVQSVVDGTYVLPANSAYLTVSSSVPDVLHIVTEEEFIAAGIDDVTFDGTPADASSAARRGTYTLSGQRVATPATKGVYIVNGRKLVVK